LNTDNVTESTEAPFISSSQSEFIIGAGNNSRLN